MWYSEIENNALQSSNKSTLLSYQTDCFLTSKRLREKCQNTDFFLVRIFPYSDWIRRNILYLSDTPYLSVFSPNVGKYGPEKALYLDTFHAVYSGSSFPASPEPFFFLSLKCRLCCCILFVIACGRYRMAQKIAFNFTACSISW